MISRQKRKISCDLLVVGGGVSGAVVAVSSARYGVRTLLIEKDSFLGGVVEKALLNGVCGAYLNGDEFPKSTLNGGMVEEILDRLKEASNRHGVVKVGKVYLLPFARGSFGRTLDSLCRDEKKLDVSLNTTAESVVTSDGKILEVTACSDGKRYQIIPKAVIDCTDSGDVAFMAGAKFQKPSRDDERQLAGYSVLIKGVVSQDSMLAIKVAYYMKEAVDQKLLPHCYKFTQYIHGETDDEAVLKFSIAELPSPERDRQTKKNVTMAVEYLRGKILPLKSCRIVEFSPCVVERETHRVCGEYILTEDDLLSNRKFEDGVVKNAWPIEIWNPQKGPTYKYGNLGDYYEIPSRCFKVKNFDNLFCAGRSISVSRTAFGSTRVIGTCIAVGEEVGRIASKYVKAESS